ncbi:PhzF family phenazine biosynthesis protein [Pseudanabaena yagii]|uniref:PhzF family phenazine biosynthesis protein n=1 Tax=Pseudanabaena yagii GIHE-NHR1 TaxID=2722753 RepID=A0ABX1M055_9CYAN|nr:PhzF family phenazine biosynthesis protein [Pseudanabaena yagii]NMF60976.1 PhzF family phenazine biosynthesis protein [Pseudanabaena yagii GIHE-NHR1]
MQLTIAIIDAFTNQVFQGNPAATALVDKFPEDAQMQQIAAEINLSETAFVKPLGKNHFQLRWFTPKREVPLCGHATLAMAHYLREIEAIATDTPLIFSTLSGDLQISFEDNLIVMDFPAAFYQNCSDRSQLVLKHIFGDRSYISLGQSADYLAVVLESESAVQDFDPPYELIAQLDGFGFIITAIADAGQDYDFVSRFFAPKAGIPEDPVTGSAHCSLTPYWSKRLGKGSLKAKQLSQRTGNLEVSDRGERVLLKGEAVTFLRGQTTYS